ncbi:hypothetical protein [Enterovibrio norvegicus]|uniref:hypothetical protein n=1 Tax=Enterovibrio norvegicus TaxID=188144 RepID=UPI0010BF308C|nr:hypothetical protein [Enterovibrio norvegicus]TKF35210.1 hypothetical protein FCV83_05790 [Enterovibrio norvegicus]
MGTKEFFIEILKYGAWPAVAAAAIYYLKDKIGNIFGGVKSAKVGDNEIQFFESAQAAGPAPEERQNLKHLIPEDPTGLREELEQKINQQLNQISGDNKKIEILIKNLAQQQIINALEKVYYNIFGSQIRLLEFLSVQAEGKAPIQAVTPFFDAAKHNSPQIFEGQHFSDYMGFLLTWGLVQNINDEWSITKHGRAFITYITAMQLTKNKAF